MSKRRVDPEDVARCEDRFNKAKAVHSVLRHVAEIKGLRLEDVYRTIGWPLYRKYGHAYDAFKHALSWYVYHLFSLLDTRSKYQCCLFLSADHSNSDSQEDIFAGLEVEEDVKTSIVSYIKRRLAPQPVKIRSDIEVTCFTYEGIDAIKEALKSGETMPVSTTELPPVKIKLIAPPLYVMTCTTLDKEMGIQQLNEAIERVQACITSKG